jgi:hypothetical protein
VFTGFLGFAKYGLNRLGRQQMGHLVLLSSLFSFAS